MAMAASANTRSRGKPRVARATTPDGAARAARVARRERRRDRSRQEILGAARRVLLRGGGLAAMTLDAVAAEVGVTKTALYYYFRSKDALLFELVFGVFEAQFQAIHDAVEATSDGAGALRAILRETVATFAPRLDDFRLAFMHGQVAGAGAVHFDDQQFARFRPLNDLAFAGAAKKVAEQRRNRPGRARVEPRLLAFLAYLAAVGLLTMKGMVESVDDPLIYSDEQLVEGFARVFAAAAAG
jgi:AcrR family transcriptional regulator